MFEKKKLAAFCFCSGNLREADFENNELVCVAKEISRQDSIQAVARLLLTGLGPEPC